MARGDNARFCCQTVQLQCIRIGENCGTNPLPYQQIRWIANEGLDPKTLKLSHDTKWVQDFRGKNLLIFTSEWAIRWILEDNPGLELAEFSREEDNL